MPGKLWTDIERELRREPRVGEDAVPDVMSRVRTHHPRGRLSRLRGWLTRIRRFWSRR